MIDLHTHLLPAVDDGSPSVEVSLNVLGRFRDDGVTVVACTPHLQASGAASAPFERHTALRALLQEKLGAGAPQLVCGFEIMLDVPGADLTDPRLALGGSRAVLVEFGRQALPPNAAAELRRIARSGIRPVLAHPERYVGCTLDLVREWRGAGAVMQLDAASMLGRGSRHELSLALLDAGLIDLIASDTHGDARSLAPARQWLTEIAGADTADLLTRRNAQRVLDSQDLEEVPAIRVRRGGGMSVLRRMFGRPSE
jgi:protein-tyrosine phosphatase